MVFLTESSLQMIFWPPLHLEASSASSPQCVPAISFASLPPTAPELFGPLLPPELQLSRPSSQVCLAPLGLVAPANKTDLMNRCTAKLMPLNLQQTPEVLNTQQR